MANNDYEAWVARFYELAQEKDAEELRDDLLDAGWNEDDVADYAEGPELWEAWAVLQMEDSEEDPDEHNEDERGDDRQGV